MKENLIKIALAALFFLCLLPMPYGFYQIVRFSALIGFAILAYSASERQNKTETVIYICLVILFQPLLKISLGRLMWNIVDVIVATGLIATIFLQQKLQNKP